MSLHYSGLTIAIDDQSWEIIAFSVNETVGIVLRIVCNTDCNAHVEGNLETIVPEIIVNHLIVESKYSHGNASYLEVSATDILASGRDYIDYLAFMQAFVHMVQCTREHPRMKALHALFLTSFQIYVFIHSVLYFLSLQPFADYHPSIGVLHYSFLQCVAWQELWLLL